MQDQPAKASTLSIEEVVIIAKKGPQNTINIKQVVANNIRTE